MVKQASNGRKKRSLKLQSSEGRNSSSRVPGAGDSSAKDNRPPREEEFQNLPSIATLELLYSPSLSSQVSSCFYRSKYSTLPADIYTMSTNTLQSWNNDRISVLINTGERDSYTKRPKWAYADILTCAERMLNENKGIGAAESCSSRRGVFDWENSCERLSEQAKRKLLFMKERRSFLERGRGALLSNGQWPHAMSPLYRNYFGFNEELHLRKRPEAAKGYGCTCLSRMAHNDFMLDCDIALNHVSFANNFLMPEPDTSRLALWNDTGLKFIDVCCGLSSSMCEKNAKDLPEMHLCREEDGDNGAAMYPSFTISPTYTMMAGKVEKFAKSCRTSKNMKVHGWPPNEADDCSCNALSSPTRQGTRRKAASKVISYAYSEQRISKMLDAVLSEESGDDDFYGDSDAIDETATADGHFPSSLEMQRKRDRPQWSH